MRWTVDVGPIGGNELKTYCVEADSWQKALQAARKLRGDSTPMSGFSIELQNDGCKAVDPASRNRYDVKRAADNTPLTEGIEAPPASRKTKIPRPTKSGKSLETPMPSSARLPDLEGPSSTASPPKAETAKSAEPPKVETAKSAEPPKVETAKSAEPPKAETAKSAEPPKAETAKSAEPPKVAVAQKPVEPSKAEASAKPTPRVLSKREQDPTDTTPLTYREYGFEVAAGSTEEAAEKVLREQLARIQGELASAPAGKLVNLAAFDEAFDGRPKSLPVTTLTWKDWRDGETIAHPRRGRQTAAEKPKAELKSVDVAPEPQRNDVAPPSKPSVAPKAEPKRVDVAPEPQRNDVAPPSKPSVAPKSAKGKPKPPPKKTPKRISGDELIAELFESMHDLHFMADSVEAAGFCLSLTSMRLPSRVALVHFYDINKREFVLVAARADDSEALLLDRHVESEPFLSKAMRKRRGLLLEKGDGLFSSSKVLAKVGGGESAVVAPVLQAGRFLGAITLVDPSEGGAFNEMDANALSYMAEQLAEFVGSRGVVVDPERIKPAEAAT